MMAHLSDEQIRGYRERSLAGADLIEASRHIGGCEACRERLATPEALAVGVRAVEVSLHTAARSVHLSYEELEGYVDGTTGAADRVFLEAHTSECPSCAADLAEIQSLRHELQAPRPSRAPRARWDEFWHALLGWRGGLVLAAAACATVAVVLVRAPATRPIPVAQVSPPPRGPEPAGAVIRDGTHVIAVASNGTIEGLMLLAEPDRATVQQALVQKRIEPTGALADLTGARGVLLGASGEPAPGKLLEPLATVVESQRPVFRWQPIAGATYRVSIYDAGYNAVAESGSLAAADWQDPTPLSRGARYSWQITVRKDGSDFTVPAPPAPEARFRVLGQAEEARIAQARSDSGGSHLVLGILYARAGLLDEAEREFSALRQQNPASEVVTGLIESVERLRVGKP